MKLHFDNIDFLITFSKILNLALESTKAGVFFPTIMVGKRKFLSFFPTIIRDPGGKKQGFFPTIFETLVGKSIVFSHLMVGKKPAAGGKF